jgi:Uma2 family endonuclease
MQKIVEVSEYELERGKPQPSKLHGYVQAKLGSNLAAIYEHQYSLFSELNLKLDDWKTVPDISIFPKIKMDYSADEPEVTEVPLCVIDIDSALQNFQELTSKIKMYFDYGVKSCWLVIPVFKNIYVFSSPTQYQIFRDTETLNDPLIDVKLELSKVFN